MTMSTPTAAVSPLSLIRMATAYWLSQALFVVAKLRIADLLSEGPRSATDLAEAVDANSTALYRILRALVGEGVFITVLPQVLGFAGRGLVGAEQ